MTSLDDVQEILDRARKLADGPLKIALYEEAVRGADLFGDMDWRFYTRHLLVRACFTGGDGERLMAALSWCLAQCDELGSCFDESSLLWGCKYALSYITGFPQISRAQIESLRTDVIRRFRKYGASLRIPYLYGMYSELSMGYPEQAAEFRPLWLRAPRDQFSEPVDWELYFDVYFHHASGAIDRALDLGLPMIDGRSPSKDVSFWMVQLLLPELLKRGERKLAVEAHQQACRRSGRNPKYIGHMGAHLTFAALTGNFARAAGLLERHLAVALRACVPSSRFSFLLNAWTAAKHMQETTSRPVRLRLSKQFPPWREEGTYEWATLADWFEAQAHALEGQFNARNGNEYYTTFFTESAALRSFATSWPLRGREGKQDSGAE